MEVEQACGPLETQYLLASGLSQAHIQQYSDSILKYKGQCIRLLDKESGIHLIGHRLKLFKATAKACEAEEEEEERRILKMLDNAHSERKLPSGRSLDFNLIKNGHLYRLKEFVIQSFKEQTPRPHQWKSVFKIMKDLLQPVENLTTKNYLLQHSTGSGKSLTIACLVYCLYFLKDIWDLEKHRFYKIIVMNDRKILDEQLGVTVSKFLQQHHLFDIERAKTSAQLLRLVEAPKPTIIVTTMQKFQKLKKSRPDILSMHEIALIADEAHRSHGKSTTRNLHEFLTGESRQSSRITYFSFTATPNAKALEMFGVKNTAGEFEPFYTYSIEQSIQEEFTLDVLSNYHSVGTVAKLTPQVDGKTTYARGNQATFHLVNTAADARIILQEKAKYILAHIRKILPKRSNPEFTAKAMLVASSRKHVLWYKEELDALLQDVPPQQRFDIVAAFTPFTYMDKRISETDYQINGKYCRAIVSSFKDPLSPVKLLIVADKFQTGFDEPMLHTLYIDKRLKGSNAVQTIGRLNRPSPGKKKPCVVDFVNNRRDIASSFSLYWRKTTLRGVTDPTPMQNKMTRIVSRLLQIPGLESNDLIKSVEYIMIEDALRQAAAHKDRLLEDDVVQYMHVCDRLQMEHNAIPYSFALRIVSELADRRRSLNLNTFKSLVDSVAISVESITETARGAIQVQLQSPWQLIAPSMGEYRARQIDEQAMTTEQIVSACNAEYRKRVADMTNSFEIGTGAAEKPTGTDSHITTKREAVIDPATLSFAKSIWASSPYDFVETSAEETTDPLFFAPSSHETSRFAKRKGFSIDGDSVYTMLARQSHTKRPKIEAASNSEAGISSVPTESASSILETLHYTSASYPLLLSALQALRALLTNDNEREVMIQGGLVPCLISHLRNLSQTHQTKHEDVYKEATVEVPVLAQGSSECSRQQSYLFLWLVAALCKVTAYVDRDSIADAIELLLLKIFVPENPLLLEAIIRALHVLCYDHENNQQRLVDRGGIPGMLSLLEIPILRLQYHIVRFLSSLANKGFVLDALAISASFRALARLLYLNEPNILFHVIHILTQLSLHNEPIRRELGRDAEVWKVICHHCLSRNEELAEQANTIKRIIAGEHESVLRTGRPAFKRFHPAVTRSFLQQSLPNDNQMDSNRSALTQSDQEQLGMRGGLSFSQQI